jgi:DNA adenine methylase
MSALIPESQKAISTRRPRVSPLRYPGGKAALYGRLREMIRGNDLSGCTYVEPFAGGAGAGLGLLLTGQVDKVVINDLDPAIHAFWQTLVEEPEYLKRRIVRARLDVTEWRKQKLIYDAADTTNAQTLAFATFYLNRTNRSGILNGGPIGGLDQTGNYKIDARFNREDLIERIDRCALYRRKIVVTSLNGRDIIRKYAGRADTFVYADPPYFEKAGSLYLNNFRAADHEDLARVLNAKADAPWVLTYDAVPQVGELYAERRRYEFSLAYSAREVRKATEIVVLSDVLQDVGPGWELRGAGWRQPTLL